MLLQSGAGTSDNSVSTIKVPRQFRVDGRCDCVAPIPRGFGTFRLPRRLDSGGLWKGVFLAEINTGIAEPARKEIADRLSTLLADTYTLYLKTHIYHWNVTGPMFNSLHVMFEGQYLELRDAVDEVAERIRALGHLAPLGYADFSRLSTISDDTDAPEALEMVRRLAAGHEAVVRTARLVVSVAEEAGDVASADLATQRIHIHEKTAWMLRATVE